MLRKVHEIAARKVARAGHAAAWLREPFGDDVSVQLISTMCLLIPVEDALGQRVG
jgi:hypothetical protein